MRALRCRDGAVTLVRNAPVPQDEREALVRVTLAGICNTDLEIVRGYAGFTGTLGHEFVGIVERSPDKGQLGKRVVGEINAGCGKCGLCRKGDPRHCEARTVLGIHNRDGAFADYLSLPPENLIPIPDAITDRQAVFTEPLAAACGILEHVEIGPQDRVVVIGDGKLGQLIARVLARTGCDLTLVGRHASNLALATACGVRCLTVNAATGIPTRSCDYVVEASGSPGGLESALGLVRPRGTVVLKSTFHGAVPVDSSKIVVDEVRLVGSRCGRFAPALRLLGTGALDLEPLIARHFPLAEGAAAVQAASAPGTLKVLLEP
jgi:threonine dehydrogenase-like Zn-dependent dehydrogenase